MSLLKKNFIYLLICTSLFPLSLVQAKIVESDTIASFQSELNYGLKSDFMSTYLWRGISYNKGFIMQPSVWVSKSDFTFEIWSNLTLHDIHGDVKRNEIDFILSYQYLWGNLSLEPSAMYYIYPKQEDSPPTGELGLTLSYQFGKFTLVNNFYCDVIKYSGAYFNESGISYEKEILQNTSLFAMISAGFASKKFNDIYTGALKSTVNLVTFNLALSYSLSEKITISPHIQFNRTIDRSVVELLGKTSHNFGVNFELEL